ncbi:hypothetical protein [Tenacibaculum sp.]|uniref:hypothetical protein n=1 Tax=Tenacibaculum sp. TaxID=1906242 RepID=UPI003AA815B6
MKKSILNLGKNLSKTQQQKINGGRGQHCCSWKDGECIYWEETGTTCPLLP